MDKWEYKTLYSDFEKVAYINGEQTAPYMKGKAMQIMDPKKQPNLNDVLANLGEEGWELVSVTNHAGGGFTSSRFYFKRRLN
jgi:hypothetical protein